MSAMRTLKKIPGKIIEMFKGEKPTDPKTETRRPTTVGPIFNSTEATDNTTNIIVSTPKAPPAPPNTTVGLETTTPYGADSDASGSLALQLGVAGAVIFLLLFLLAIYCSCRRRRKRKKKTPPELPHPYVSSTGRHNAEPRVIFMPARGSSGGQVQCVVYKPLPGEALVPSRKQSSQVISPASPVSDKDFEIRSDNTNSSASAMPHDVQSIYGNGEVVRESRTSTMKNEDVNNDQSRESLYVRPSSWLTTDVSGQCEEENTQGCNINRSRLDSQKYLLPELVLQLPKDARKASGGSLGGNVTAGSLHDNGFNLKWKARAPIIHTADEPNRKSSVYVCMDSGSSPTSHSRNNDPIKSNKDGNSSSGPFNSLPPPCKIKSNNVGYINVREPPSSEPGIYEAPSSLELPVAYENAREIFRSSVSPLKAGDDRNEPDTYRIFISPDQRTGNSNERDANVPSEHTVTENDA
ncbi:hypothetical protein EGW08_014278, partial [Elysia chlorotica]